jgi:error-prone DNA polymerase
VAVAGINVVHQAPPTAKGFHFVTLEDEAGFMNVIFRPYIYGSFRRIVHATHLLYVEGQVEREGDVINVMARRVQPLAPILVRHRVRT